MFNKIAERDSSMTKRFRLGLFFAVSFLGAMLGSAPSEAVWRGVTSGTSNDLTAVHFVDANTGWAVGASGTILKTTDGGVTWTAQTSGVSTNIQDVKFSGASSSTGIAVGSSGLILRTTDAVTWQSMNNAGDTNSLFGLSWSVSTGVVWAVGQSGTVRKSIDSGSGWSDANPNGDIPAAQNLRSIFFVNSTTGIVVGDGGTLYRTVNGGNSWVNISTGATQNLKDVFFVDSSTGFIVGDSGITRKTTDAGITWTAHGSTSTNFTSLHYVSATTGWVVGQNGIIIKSTDSGLTYQQETSTFSSNLADIYFPNTTLGIAVGASGTILRNNFSSAASTGTFTATEVQGSLMPINNLFDPSLGESTTLRYYFKKDGQVTLRIYTMQGRLIKTLLNEVKAAGIYEDVFWDGKNGDGETVAAGIYLVHMEAPNFSFSQKIAVVR